MGKNPWGEEDSFLSFRRMISPSLIVLLYVLGAIGITIAGFLTIIDAVEARRSVWGGPGVMWTGILSGIAIIVLGNLLWRVFCEGLIVLFSIHDLLDSIDRRLRSLSFPDSSSVREALSPIAKELREGTLRLISIEQVLKGGLQQIQGMIQPPPPIVSKPTEKPPDQAIPQGQQAQSPQAQPSPSPSLGPTPTLAEKPRPRRHWGRWVFLFFFLAIGIFVALPIVSGHTKPQGLEPRAVSKFFVDMWNYWVEVVGGLK